MDIIRLWLHEASRVYGDKMIEEKDMETFKKIKYEIAKAGFEVHTQDPLLATYIMFHNSVSLYL